MIPVTVNSRNLFVQRGQIVLADLPCIEGSIQTGSRPVVVVSNDKNNCFSPNVTVIPLSTNINKNRNFPTHLFIQRDSCNNLEKDSLALGEQILTIPKSSIISKGGILSKGHMMAINRILLIQLGVQS